VAPLRPPRQHERAVDVSVVQDDLCRRAYLDTEGDGIDELLFMPSIIQS